MSSTPVLVVEVVGVLPDVEGEEGLEAVGDGIISASVLGNGEGAFFIGLEPDPATTEEAHAFNFELSFKGVYTSPLLHDGIQEMPGRSRA